MADGATVKGAKRIGLKDVMGIPPNTAIWDGGKGAVPGFGARRRHGPSVTYFVMYRNGAGRQLRYTIGTHGAPWTPDAARERAKEILGAVARGEDPQAEKRTQRRAATVSELCDLYLADAEAGRLLTRRGVAKKGSTLVTDRSRIDRHIRPLLGAMKVPAVARSDVERFMHAVAEGKTAQRAKTGKKRGLSNVRGGKGAASRTVGLLGSLFTYAVKHGLRPDNPVTGVVRFADGKRKRRLSDDEYAALGRGLAALSAPPEPCESGGPDRAALWPAAIAAARFLALTGWRSGEALDLRWGMVDLTTRTARLPDTKTGESVRPLSRAACDVLRALGPGKMDARVFAASRGAGAMTGFPRFFARIVKAGGLPEDVTPHVLRHSFASLADDLGCSEPTIAALVGHKGGGTTRGYVHKADAFLLAAADKVADETAKRMGESPAAGVVVRLDAARASA